MSTNVKVLWLKITISEISKKYRKRFNDTINDGFQLFFYRYFQNSLLFTYTSNTTMMISNVLKLKISISEDYYFNLNNYQFDFISQSSPNV